jgi:hypothetical protein
MYPLGGGGGAGGPEPMGGFWPHVGAGATTPFCRSTTSSVISSLLMGGGLTVRIRSIAEGQQYL